MTHADHFQLASSLAWSLIGLTSGYGLGRYHARKKCCMNTDDPSPARRGAKTPLWRDRWGLTRTIGGLLILILVIGTMGELAHTTSCQAAYNAAVTRSITARAEESAAQLDTQIAQLDAQVVLLADYPPSSGDEARRAEALRRAETYRQAALRNRDALVKLRDSRIAAPLPAGDPCD